MCIDVKRKFKRSMYGSSADPLSLLTEMQSPAENYLCAPPPSPITLMPIIMSVIMQQQTVIMMMQPSSVVVPVHLRYQFAKLAFCHDPFLSASLPVGLTSSSFRYAACTSRHVP